LYRVVWAHFFYIAIQKGNTISVNSRCDIYPIEEGSGYNQYKLPPLSCTQVSTPFS